MPAGSWELSTREVLTALQSWETVKAPSGGWEPTAQFPFLFLLFPDVSPFPSSCCTFLPSSLPLPFSVCLKTMEIGKNDPGKHLG